MAWRQGGGRAEAALFAANIAGGRLCWCWESVLPRYGRNYNTIYKGCDIADIVVKQEFTH